MGIQRLLVLRVQLQRAQIQTPLALKRQMLMKKTTWSMMEMGGGLSMVSLNNLLLICLTPFGRFAMAVSWL
uniref:Uncharacterized protein n=1 Tax=Salix viminalis TaxID=40686 RepID=A0A6N2NHF6_SALVM